MSLFYRNITPLYHRYGKCFFGDQLDYMTVFNLPQGIILDQFCRSYGLNPKRFRFRFLKGYGLVNQVLKFLDYLLVYTTAEPKQLHDMFLFNVEFVKDHPYALYLMCQKDKARWAYTRRVIDCGVDSNLVCGVNDDKIDNKSVNMTNDIYKRFISCYKYGSRVFLNHNILSVGSKVWVESPQIDEDFNPIYVSGEVVKIYNGWYLVKTKNYFTGILFGDIHLGKPSTDT